ncbi:MAG: amidase, partial [Acidimicrobiaceae bacterium]|nr:amidase [Acidimicrobiaceae bacterium]
IRIPSACCGVFGLKTTFGRIPLEGVWPLAPSLDSVGPLAANVQMLEAAMQLLEPGFAKVPISKPKVAVLDNSGSPEVLAGIEAILGLVTTSVTRIDDPGLDSAREAGLCLMLGEALKSNRGLLDESHRLDPAVVGRLLKAASFLESDFKHAAEIKEIFTARINDRLGVHDFLALPTLRIPVPSLYNAGGAPLNANTMPFNLAGLPAISIPVSVTRSLINTLNLDLSQLKLGFRADGAESMPISLQIVGPMGSEEELIGFAQIIESVLGDI